MISGSRFHPAPMRWLSDRGGIRMTFHSEHQPLEAHGRALEAAGLLIEAMLGVLVRPKRPAGYPCTDPGALCGRQPLAGPGAGLGQPLMSIWRAWACVACGERTAGMPSASWASPFLPSAAYPRPLVAVQLDLTSSRFIPQPGHTGGDERSGPWARR